MWNDLSKSYVAQLPILNGRKCSPTFYSTFPILVITKISGCDRTS